MTVLNTKRIFTFALFVQMLATIFAYADSTANDLGAWYIKRSDGTEFLFIPGLLIDSASKSYAERDIQVHLKSGLWGKFEAIEYSDISVIQRRAAKRFDDMVCEVVAVTLRSGATKKSGCNNEIGTFIWQDKKGEWHKADLSIGEAVLPGGQIQSDYEFKPISLEYTELKILRGKSIQEFKKAFVNSSRH